MILIRVVTPPRDFARMPPVRVESSPPLFRGRNAAPQFVWWQVASDYLRQLLTLGFVFLTNVVLSPPALVLSWFPGLRIPPDSAQRMITWLIRCWLGFARVIRTIQVELPDGKNLRDLRGVVVVSNHPSLIDAFLLLAVLPRTVCVMRADLASNLIFGGLSRLAGFVPNDRGLALVRGGLEKIRDGENLLIFPEGTRTRCSSLNPFTKSFAVIARKAGAPIQTILIEREGLYLSKHLPLLARAALPVRFRVSLGEIIHPRAGESAAGLSQRVESYFLERLENDGENIRLVQRPRP